MTLLTRTQAVNASQKAWGYRSAAESQVKKSFASSMDTSFDIFLSHSHEDAEVVAGLKAILEGENLSIYVDWLEDPQVDRTKVTPKTAEMLRSRMNHCRMLMFATSHASAKSAWMPWELGYFDGKHPGRVGILPIVQSVGDRFVGQEYLGLYPKYELINFTNYGTRLGTYTGPNEGELLGTVVRR